MINYHLTQTPAQFQAGQPTTQAQRAAGHLIALAYAYRMGEHDCRVMACAADALAETDHLHTLAVQARDARTSADRRAALDALERAALALGGDS